MRMTGIFTIMIFLSLSMFVGCGTSTEEAMQNIESAEVAVESIKEEKAELNDNSTLGEKNALQSAKSYIESGEFSKKGLIEQLEYEGFSKKDATYGADNCGADWHEEAAQSAKSYMESSSFSRSGLIEQLEYEGFTKEQAKYGADAVGY